MKKALLFFYFIGIFFCLPVSAYADTSFFLFPQKDVQIIYHISVKSQVRLPSEAVLYSADHGQLLKLTAFDQPFYLLFNQKKKTAFLVSPEIYSYFNLPLNGKLPLFLKEVENASRQKIGQRIVGGFSCILWRFTALPKKYHGRVCITSDGVLMQAEGGFQGSGKIIIQAMSVTPEVFPINFFSPPANFLHLGTLPSVSTLF